MAKRKLTKKSKRPIEQYEHKDKERVYNTPVGHMMIQQFVVIRNW